MNEKLEALRKALNDCYARRVDVILGDSEETIEQIEKERRELMDAYSPGISEREVYEAFGVPKSYFVTDSDLTMENEE
jgi:hypothetical protein